MFKKKVSYHTASKFLTIIGDRPVDRRPDITPDKEMANMQIAGYLGLVAETQARNKQLERRKRFLYIISALGAVAVCALYTLLHW